MVLLGEFQVGLLCTYTHEETGNYLLQNKPFITLKSRLVKFQTRIEPILIHFVLKREVNLCLLISEKCTSRPKP